MVSAQAFTGKAAVCENNILLRDNIATHGPHCSFHDITDRSFDNFFLPLLGIIAL